MQFLGPMWWIQFPLAVVFPGEPAPSSSRHMKSHFFRAFNPLFGAKSCHLKLTQTFNASQPEVHNVHTDDEELQSFATLLNLSLVPAPGYLVTQLAPASWVLKSSLVAIDC